MKKVLTALVILLTASSCFAYIKEGTTSDIETLKETTYSEATLKAIDTIKANNTYGSNGYESYYDNQEKTKKQYVSNWYSKIKAWFDPAQDDGYFGNHEINYDNRFFLMQPSQNTFDEESPDYYKNYKKQQEVEDL